MSERVERALRELASAVREEVAAIPDGVGTLAEEIARDHFAKLLAAALASRDAEIERLRGELRRAHLKRLVELSEEFGGYDELSTSALSALKTAREGNNA